MNLLRQKRWAVPAALLACLGMLVFLFTSPSAYHPPELHFISFSDSESAHDSDHGHSHDVDDENAPKSKSHHHADHSHEKADQVQPMVLSAHFDAHALDIVSAHALAGIVPQGLDRPPRAMMTV